jgi:hypothetical protein
MARIGLLTAVVAALLPVAAANAQQLSENDIFALYCLGVFRFSSAGLAENYRKACPTGNEQDCAWMRGVGKTSEDGFNRVKRYIGARGYLHTTSAGRFAVEMFKDAEGKAHRSYKEPKYWQPYYRIVRHCG